MPVFESDLLGTYATGRDGDRQDEEDGDRDDLNAELQFSESSLQNIFITHSDSQNSTSPYARTPRRLNDMKRAQKMIIQAH